MVLFMTSIRPIKAQGELTPISLESVSVYTISTSDRDPIETLKKQMIEEHAEGVEVDVEASSIAVTNFDSTLTGIQNVTITTYVTDTNGTTTTHNENAVIRMEVDAIPSITLTQETVELTNGDSWQPETLIDNIYDDAQTLPTLRMSKTVDTSTDGTYVQDYTVIDQEGNTATAQVTVTVTTPEPEPEPEPVVQPVQQARTVEPVQQASPVQEVAASAAPVTSTSGNPYGGGWGNCTYSCWELVLQHRGIALPNFGSASSWASTAASYGYGIGGTPVAGSIAVYSGHVAYVASVSADGSSVYILEGGFNGGYNERWVSASGTGRKALIAYIYL